MSAPVLELSEASKSYDGNRILSGVSLTIDRGEFVAIVGFSGSGKTTLLSMLAGLVRPDAGRALFHGASIDGPGPERGVVFQSYSLLPWLSAFENVHLAVSQVLSKRSAADQRAHTERYISLVGLSHAKDRRPAELSGGMRQRVALARALAIEPEVLLLDEPLSALDALTRATLQDEMQRIARSSGTTFLLVTNDVDEAILLADRIIPLGAGPAATLGPATDVGIPRPRNRRALNHDPAFRRIRASLTEYLLSTQRAKRGGSRATSDLALGAVEAPT